VVACAALTNNDVSCDGYLSTEDFYA